MVFGTCKRRRMFYVTDLSMVLRPKRRRKSTGEMLSGMMKGSVLYWAALVSFVPTKKQLANYLKKHEAGVKFAWFLVSLNLALFLLSATLSYVKYRN